MNILESETFEADPIFRYAYQDHIVMAMLGGYVPLMFGGVPPFIKTEKQEKRMYQDSITTTSSDRNGGESGMSVTKFTSHQKFVDDPKASGIDREYSELIAGLAALQEHVEVLERRLAPILRNEPPMAENSMGEAREVPSCLLAESISRDANFLRESNRRINSIINRIEL